MDKIETTLWADYNNVSKQINTCTSKDEHYKFLHEEKDKIRNELLKLQQMKSEHRKDVTHIVFEGVTFVGTLVYGVFGLYKTFYFEKDTIVTSTIGKAILNGTIPKLFKR